MIHRLNRDTIQKIAAGEVIERPVSVVKELVENAIDAGATRIGVDIENGGKTLIRVTDNGSGIPADQIELAFERHATSKIVDFNDLYETHSLGFRGEALASIIAVARVTARSKTANSEVGTSVRFENSEIVEKLQVAMQVGTTVEVSDIFYNVPVRRKFMKSDQAEANKISALLYSLAVGNPDISLSFTRDGKRVFITGADNTLDDNLMILFGMSYYEALLPISASSEHFRLSGRIGNNTFYRGNRQMQFLYVNGRFVQDDGITEAIENQYRSIIPNGRYPAFQLYIETSPGLIDINIHPNKQKVRFDCFDELEALVRQAVHDAIFGAAVIPGAQVQMPANRTPDLASADSYKQILERYRRTTGDFGEHRSVQVHEASYSPAEAVSRQRFAACDISDGYELEMVDDLTDERIEPDDDKPAQPACGTMPDKPAEVRSDVEQTEMAQSRLKQEPEHPYGLPALDGLSYIGVVFKTFLMFESKLSEELILIDQHAAHERINYERFMRQFRTGKVITQNLMQPVSLTLTDIQMDALSRRGEILRRMGFEFDPFGEHTVLLRAVPTIFKTPEDDKLFFTLLDLSIERLDSVTSIVDHIATKACKASVKGGDALSLYEVEALYRQLLGCEYPLSCPHGRPTLLRLSRYEMEKLFMRVK